MMNDQNEVAELWTLAVRLNTCRCLALSYIDEHFGVVADPACGDILLELENILKQTETDITVATFNLLAKKEKANV